MTDPPSSSISHTAPSEELIVGPASAFAKSAPFSTISPVPEEQVEDYTIKCICGYQEDDGNTVYCEPCDTWQHTECYYTDANGIVPSSNELSDIDHYCADCSPRYLDTKGAIERQRNRREDLDPSERKVKKPASKSHKKKIKVPDSNGAITNGCANGNDSDLFYDRTSRSPRDYPSSGKRTKTNHRLSNSMNITLLPSSSTSHSQMRSASNAHSPIKISHKQLYNGYNREQYHCSNTFLHLYDADPGEVEMQANSYNDVNILNSLSLWAQDPEELRSATHGYWGPQDVFHRSDEPISSMTFPQLRKETKQDEDCVIDGRYPKWFYITIDGQTPKGSMVGELKGKVGHMQNYRQDPVNRWDYLRHPEPFVFFHPKLPIYIDTRLEGTACRYLRRSCKPNLHMTTILDGTNYHFCFVAKEDIPSGAELTIGWVPDEHVRRALLPDRVKVENASDADDEYIADWVGKVFPEFGGCACGSPSRCSLYQRRLKALSKDRNGYFNKQSPPGPGYTKSSRDGSEHNDSRSTSGSNLQSRDRTPTSNTAGDGGFGKGLEQSEREKRKLAALEETFKQLENDKHQPVQKRKKRNSGESNINTPNTGTSKQLGHTLTPVSQPDTPRLASKPQYAVASTSQRTSGSPTTKSSSAFSRSLGTVGRPTKRTSQPKTLLVPSPLLRQNYTSTAVQTDPDEDDDWYKPSVNPAPRRKRYISLTQRLLIRSQKDYEDTEARRKALSGLSVNQSTANRAWFPSPDQSTNGSIVPAPEDTEMPDTETAHSPVSTRLSPTPGYVIDSLHLRVADMNTPSTTEIKPPPRPWPSDPEKMSDEQPHRAGGIRHTNIRVQLPSKPPLTSDPPSNTPTLETPKSAVPRSPYTQTSSSYPPLFSTSSSTLVQPSPIKKKVSLSAYFERKKSQSTQDKPTSESPKMQHRQLKPLENIGNSHENGNVNGEVKGTAIEGTGIVETPKQEEEDPMVNGETGDMKSGP